MQYWINSMHTWYFNTYEMYCNMCHCSLSHCVSQPLYTVFTVYACTCLLPVLVCVSSFAAFWPVFLCADELLPVFSFAEPLLETEPSSLGNLLWVAMETEAAISGQRWVRCGFSDRLAHPPALMVTWVNSLCVTKTPPPVLLKKSCNSRTLQRQTLLLAGYF